MSVAVVRVRFDTNPDPSSVWSDELTENWLQPLRPFSLAHYWWLSSHGYITIDHRLYPPVVMSDPRGRPEALANPRAALVSAAIDAATNKVKPDWEGTDILLLLFAQPTEYFGGGTAQVPLRDGGTKTVRVTVVDVQTRFADCCQELGHSLGFNHEVNAAGGEYASPYSCMSSATSTAMFVRGADPALPDGLPLPAENGIPAQRIVGAMLTGAQLLSLPGFRGSPWVRNLGANDVRAPVTVRLYRPNYRSHLPGPPAVLLTLPSLHQDGRLFAVEFRRGGDGYEAGIGMRLDAPAGLVVHSLNPDGRVRYDGVASLSLYQSQTDWPCPAGGFTLRYLGVDPAQEYVDLEVRPGAAYEFPIRGALLLGGFRSQDELNRMSHDDMRNTLIVELTNHSAQNDYQAYDNETLAGMGAVMVALRRLRIRDDDALRTMTADDQRNTLIVELDAQTGAGQRLQGFSNLELVQILLGSALVWRGIDLTAVDRFIRGVLLVGGFRSQHGLNAMSFDDQRNTLIVELTNHSNQSNYQGYSDQDLAGAGAVMVAMRELGIRDDATLRTMSSDDQRNTLIVVLDTQTGLGARLQALSNLDLALVPLGVQKAVP